MNITMKKVTRRESAESVEPVKPPNFVNSQFKIPQEGNGKKAPKVPIGR